MELRKNWLYFSPPHFENLDAYHEETNFWIDNALVKTSTNWANIVKKKKRKKKKERRDS